MKKLILFLNLAIALFFTQAQCLTYLQEPTVYDTVYETKTVIVGFVKDSVLVYEQDAFTEQVLQCTPNSMKICEQKHAAIREYCEVMRKVEKDIIKKKIIVVAGKVRPKPCD